MQQKEKTKKQNAFGRQSCKQAPARNCPLKAHDAIEFKVKLIAVYLSEGNDPEKDDKLLVNAIWFVWQP